MAKRKRTRRWGRLLLGALAILAVAFVGFSVREGEVRTAENVLSWEGESGASSTALDPLHAEYVRRIRETYSYSPELAEIVDNVSLYSESMLETLLTHAEMIDFFRNYPESRQYGLDSGRRFDLSGECSKGEIPLLLQWDTRWGYEIYGSDLFALNGCGPTCFAMVYVGLTGDTKENPLTIGEMCIRKGYYYFGQGTGAELFDEGVRAYGLSSRRLPLSVQAVLDSLRQGRPVVVNVGEGDFTSYGHYIVLAGLAADGGVEVRDPNSPQKSHSWDAGRIVSQAYTMWSVWRR